MGELALKSRFLPDQIAPAQCSQATALVGRRHFATVEEAALIYSRCIGREAATQQAEAAAAALPAAQARAAVRSLVARGDVAMTAEEALAAAEAEGLPLVVNARDHKNGHAYKHVSWGQGAYNLAYKNKVATPDGSASMPKQQFLGCVRTSPIFAFAPSNALRME